MAIRRLRSLKTITGFHQKLKQPGVAYQHDEDQTNLQTQLRMLESVESLPLASRLLALMAPRRQRMAALDEVASEKQKVIEACEQKIRGLRNQQTQMLGGPVSQAGFYAWRPRYAALLSARQSLNDLEATLASEEQQHKRVSDALSNINSLPSAKPRTVSALRRLLNSAWVRGPVNWLRSLFGRAPLLSAVEMANQNNMLAAQDSARQLTEAEKVIESLSDVMDERQLSLWKSLSSAPELIAALKEHLTHLNDLRGITQAQIDADKSAIKRLETTPPREWVAVMEMQQKMDDNDALKRQTQQALDDLPTQKTAIENQIKMSLRQHADTLATLRHIHKQFYPDERLPEDDVALLMLFEQKEGEIRSEMARVKVETPEALTALREAIQATLRTLESLKIEKEASSPTLMGKMANFFSGVLGPVSSTPDKSTPYPTPTGPVRSTRGSAKPPVMDIPEQMPLRSGLPGKRGK